MATNIRDFLTKQLFVDKNIVTFRSLSRQFNIHVNAAKNELANFYANPDPSSGSVHATYLVTGEPAPARTSRGDEMDVDDNVQGVEEDDGEQVDEVKVTLVGEQDLESVKATYARVYSQHIYCLSPSALIDAGLVCAPSEKVHEVDSKLKPDEAAFLGRVTGPHVRKGKPVKFTAVPAKEPLSRKPTEVAASKSKDTSKNEDKKDEKSAEQKKLKPSGTLDWSKAKPKAKEEKPKEPVQAKEEKAKEEPKPKTKPAPPAKPLKPAASKPAIQPKQEPKRGVKRKSALTMDSSEEDDDAAPPSRPSTKPSSPAASSPVDSPSPPPVTQARVPTLKRMVVVSDDEDDAPVRPVRGKARARPAVDVDVDALPSNKEASLRAMMDIDDGEVERASARRKAPPPPPSSEPEPSPRASPASSSAADEAERDGDGDVSMAPEEEDEDEAYLASLDAHRPRKRRAPKKAVPRGRNGLPKRRVVRSRMTVDEKGFMVTVDESEYESVDENDPDARPASPLPPPKGRKAAKKKVEVKPEDTEPEEDDVPEEKTVKKGGKRPRDEPKEKEKEQRKGFRPGPPVKRSSKSAQGSLRDFFGKK